MIPDLYTELEFRTSKSGGKGGQHVNKTESKVELRFHPAESRLLTDAQKELLISKWSNKLDTDGWFHLTEESERSQIRNKELLIEKFYRLLKAALKPVKPRKATKLPKTAKKKREESKKRHSEIKAGRKKPEW